jgi:hypothetical protein
VKKEKIREKGSVTAEIPSRKKKKKEKKKFVRKAS